MIKSDEALTSWKEQAEIFCEVRQSAAQLRYLQDLACQRLRHQQLIEKSIQRLQASELLMQRATVLQSKITATLRRSHRRLQKQHSFLPLLPVLDFDVVAEPVVIPDDLYSIERQLERLLALMCGEQVNNDVESL